MPYIRVAAVLLVFAASSARAQFAFTGNELLGRATDRSISLNVVANAAMDAYVEYGIQAGGPYPLRTPATGSVTVAANAPVTLALTGLTANTRYYYRLNFRPGGVGTFSARTEHSFMTQRPAGSTFVFTVTSDAHVNVAGLGNATLFPVTMQAIAAEGSDLHFDLGDTFGMDAVSTQAGANSTYLAQRAFFDVIGHSTPVHTVLGNHEEEEGWHLSDAGFTPSLAAISANARKAYYPNPNPTLDGFYTGNTDLRYAEVSGNHSLEDYYAFQWGDALFVAIDPYWYSTSKPFVGNTGGGEGFLTGTGNRWDWTLGRAQYDWLKQTLENSKATYKFIFAHQIVGGDQDYGRGGANAVPYCEWGGFNTDGLTQAFAVNRPTWSAPIHQLLVQNNVTAFIHGHDHEFAYERRDGVVYQEMPMAADVTYGTGFNDYHEGDPYTLRVLPNSGHLRITVTPARATVDYVRAFLPGAGTNGQVAYSYTLLPSTAIASDFSLGAAGASLAATTSAGQNASYSLLLVPAGGYSGTVSLACSGAPAQANCLATPQTIAVSGGVPVAVRVDVTTTRRTAQAPVAAAALSLLLWLVVGWGVPARDWRRRAWVCVVLLAGLAGLQACGGGGDGSTSGTATNGNSSSSSSSAVASGTPAGNYTLTLSATGGSVTRTATLSLTVN